MLFSRTTGARRALFLARPGRPLRPLLRSVAAETDRTETDFDPIHTADRALPGPATSQSTSRAGRSRVSTFFTSPAGLQHTEPHLTFRE